MRSGTSPEVVLETERLLLRTFTDADVDDLLELDSDPAVTRFITNGEPTPRATVIDEILPAFLGYYASSTGYGFWAAIERDGGAFIGWFHLRPPPEHGRPDEPELGYRLRRASWGKGYATEGSRALVDRAFADLGASRVFAETMVVNTASRRVMEKAGLRMVRTFHADWPVRIPGDELGDVEYAITRDEWEQDLRRAARSGT
jgi:RimJ/RimL family protein N-acetyltransferase